EPEVIDALRKIRLDNDISRNHSARNVRIVRAIVAVDLRLRHRSHSSDIRSAGYRVCPKDVVDRTKSVFGADQIRKSLVQELHPNGHVHHGARTAPRADTRWHAERGGVQPLVQT